MPAVDSGPKLLTCRCSGMADWNADPGSQSLAKVFGYRHLFTRLIPGMSGDAPFALVLE